MYSLSSLGTPATPTRYCKRSTSVCRSESVCWPTSIPLERLTPSCPPWPTSSHRSTLPRESLGSSILASSSRRSSGRMVCAVIWVAMDSLLCYLWCNSYNMVHLTYSIYYGLHFTAITLLRISVDGTVHQASGPPW